MGDVAEWLRSGLQIRGHRFESGRRLHLKLLQKVKLIKMSHFVNKEYILNIIKKIVLKKQNYIQTLWKFLFYWKVRI